MYQKAQISLYSATEVYLTEQFIVMKAELKGVKAELQKLNATLTTSTGGMGPAISMELPEDIQLPLKDVSALNAINARIEEDAGIKSALVLHFFEYL